MNYELKWGNRTWLYALALGLGIGLAVLLIFKSMLGDKTFWNYYSPMLGYYVLISICQSHYFRREPKPDMGGIFRQFVSIFGAVLIFYVNESVMLYIFGVPQAGGFAPPTEYIHGSILTGGHFTFIVFGFFIYGFDDFMFKGKLVGWMKNDLVKALFWYLVIWVVWGILFYSDIGAGRAHSKDTFDGMALNRMLAISQWMIIMSLLYALVFRDWLSDLQERSGIESDMMFGLLLFGAAALIGAGIAYLLFYTAPLISPAGAHLTDSETWHHVLYMGTYPLTPAVLLGLYTANFNHVRGTGSRVVRRLAVLIPSIIALYFAYHWFIARPEILINFFADGTVDKGMGLFGEPHHNWYHQLDLYFNFTVSIIPLTHHWFCGKAGFMREVPDREENEEIANRNARIRSRIPAREAVDGNRAVRAPRSAWKMQGRRSSGYRDSEGPKGWG